MLSLKHGQGQVFEEGTIVRLRCLGKADPVELIKKFGRVVIPNKYGFFGVGVEFFEWDKGHDMNGILATPSGWYLPAWRLEITAYERPDADGKIVLVETIPAVLAVA